MDEQIVSKPSFLLVVGRNLIALTACWVMAFLVARIVNAAGLGPFSDLAGLLLSALIGAAVCLALRARPAAYLVLASVAVFASELVIRVSFGIGMRALPGAAAEFAMLATGILGVTFGALLAHRSARANQQGLQRSA